jgi:DNA-binding phage protein
MTDKDIFAERGRSLEDDYFRKKDRELIEKMKQAAQDEESRRELGQKTGLSDPELLKDLQDLGFTPETLALLPIVPVVQLAWAEGGITAAERTLIVDLARQRGIAHGSAADRQLEDWMNSRPDESVFRRATRLIAAILDSGHDAGIMTADEVVKQAENIAYASGGILGLARVSHEEKAILASLASALKSRKR